MKAFLPPPTLPPRPSPLPPCRLHFEWIRTNVFLVTSRSEYLDPQTCSRVPVINALYKVPWKGNAPTDGCAPAISGVRARGPRLRLREPRCSWRRPALPVRALDADDGRRSDSDGGYLEAACRLFPPQQPPNAATSPRERPPLFFSPLSVFADAHNKSYTLFLL